jgi:hypothetical protein
MQIQYSDKEIEFEWQGTIFLASEVLSRIRGDRV